MAGQNQYGFLKTLFLLGFGSMAVAFWLQRKELHKHGYDMHAMGVPTVDFKLLTPAQLAAVHADINNPLNAPGTAGFHALAGKPGGKETQDVITWIHANKAESNKLYLINSATTPTLASLAADHTKPPALIKDAAGDVHAYLKTKRGLRLRNLGQAAALVAPYKDLHFPNKPGQVKSVTAPSVVGHLVSRGHIAVSSGHLHADSHLDNRALVMSGNNGSFASVMQAANGQYIFKRLDTTVAADISLINTLTNVQHEFAGTATTVDASGARVTHVKEVNRATYADLIDATVDSMHTKAATEGGIKSASSRFTNAKLAENLHENGNMLLFTGALTAAPTLIKTAMSFANRVPDMIIYGRGAELTHMGSSMKNIVKTTKDKLHLG